MAITFDEALKAIDEKSDMEPYSGLFLIEIEDAKAIVMKLANTYAPTIEMTQAQYDIFNSALAASKESENDFIYFIDNLDTQSHFYGDIFGKELSVFINDSRYLMQAWLHPETIKVVD